MVVAAAAVACECAVKADTSMLEPLLPAGVTSKKTLIAREQDRPDISRNGKRWRKYRRHIDPSRLVFIDETWAKTYRWRKPSAMPVRGSPRDTTEAARRIAI